MYSGGAHPFPAVDTYDVRATERLQAFVSEVETQTPKDQYFPDYPALNWMLKNTQKTRDGGAQLIGHIGKGESPNFKRAEDWDEYDTSGTDETALWVYPWKNTFDSWALCRREIRELEGKDHAMFDRIKEDRERIINTCLKYKSADLFSATQVNKGITALNIGIDSTGSIGNLSQSSVPVWASYEANHASAAFSAGGYERMVAAKYAILDRKGRPKVIFVPLAIAAAIELQFDADVRYGNASELTRGQAQDVPMLFSGIPIIADSDCTSGTMYFIDPRFCYFVVDSEDNMRFGEVEKFEKSWTYGQPFINTDQLIISGRREQGKIYNIV